MANHEIRPGSWGKVPRAKMRSDGRWVANGRYKNLDGAIIQRFRTGSTARKAEYSLLALFQEMAAQDEIRKKSAEEKLATKRPHPTDILFSHVVEDWIAYIQAGGQGLRISTAYEYARMARADIVPALGELRLADIDIKTCADFLHGIVDSGRFYAKAEHNRAVLSNVLTWCAGRGLISGNPVRQVASLPRPPKKQVQIIEKEDMATVLAAIRSYGEKQVQVRRPGPRQNLDIPDGVELLMATGMRISELLALRWEDVHIDKPDKGSYWVQINGKVGWEKGHPMLRHSYRKTDDKILDLRISPEVAAMLRARRANEQRANPNGAIFAARGGKWMQLNNFRRRWRIVRQELEITYDLPEEDETSGRKQERRESCDIDTATPHTFRRSVGTFIGETVSIDQAAQQLGHKRTAVTIRSYLRERQEAPDSSGHLASVMYKRDKSTGSPAQPTS
ncbi:Tyrosine recombinase XerC [Arthrobacter sp. Bi26]|uniref:tyrosine-type recombinase/integrase n=1 Tax=Arthrobacter sp. Bi26 TaxID=2822350 RepID=UPI001D8B1A71|nr:site-specific integrase [Arthrobacter sp. Bi26]CAH0135708.1 Tyrosine recombinase XerC [Arthrobacter sp. Bi26]